MTLQIGSDKNSPMGEFPLMDSNKGIPLFYPHIPRGAREHVLDTLSGRWIGQGPKVERFEREFKAKYLGEASPLAVGSGTDALHLAYLLAGVGPGDEVICPVFTCTATNLPLLYLGAKPVFADIDPATMNVSIDDIKSKISRRTKAIVTVDYGGIPCQYDELGLLAKRFDIPIIQDAAHSLGAVYKGMTVGRISDYTIFSFQAIKALTTGDGGLLAIKDSSKLGKGQRLRWFGIDRQAKQAGVWENDIVELGYKYQMNDIAAALGLAGLEMIASVVSHRNNLFKIYEERLAGIKGLSIVGKSSTAEYFNSAWLITVLVEDRPALVQKLRSHGVESAQVHYRNDRYTVFGGRVDGLRNMDALEDKYLVLPLYPRLTPKDVESICGIISAGW